MKRLVIVYNPRSARFLEVQRKVIDKARELKGWMVCKFEVEKASVEENAEKLSLILRKGDLVVSAGGDGTATMVLNAIIKSEKLVTMAGMGFGNFNDFVGTFGEMDLRAIVRKFEEGKYEDLYPLEIRIDEKHFRYAGMYFTMGMFAESTGVFEREKVRRRMAKVKNRLSYSANKLFFWYLRNKWRNDLLPEGSLVKADGFNEKLTKGTTDYIALNGESLAGVVPAAGWTREPKKFFVIKMRNRSFFRMLREFVRAMEDKLGGEEVEESIIVFDKPSKIFVHSEGEQAVFEKVKKVEVKKTGAKLRVIRA